MKLSIGDELQSLFHLIVNATKQAAEETRKELTPMKKSLTDIDGALAAQRAAEARSKPPPDKNADRGGGDWWRGIRNSEVPNLNFCVITFFFVRF